MKPKCIRRGAALLLAAVLAAASAPMSVHADNIPPGVICVLTTPTATTFYYDTPESGGLQAMWDDAVEAPTAMVKLFTDWNSKDGTKLVKGGKGAAFDGVICIPKGHEVTLDLNGYKIDRALGTAIDNGEVIYIDEGATLNLTDTTASAGGQGMVTGGNSTNSAGGIHVAKGGKLNLWGGSITGNQTEANGGGIVLEGEGTSLYMTGGKIEKNTAKCSGGGIAMAEASVEAVSGSITENTAGENGGGIFQQGGTVSFQAGAISSNSAVAGGGICTIADAELTLKGTVAIQNNVAGNVNEQGKGGGIYAQSSKPIHFAGSPNISGNRQSDGTVSNLTFFVSDMPFVGPRVIDDGVGSMTKIGVNFIGGEEREMGFAPSWSNPVFTPDGAFELIQADGVQYLKRPAVPEDYMLFVWIGIGAFVVILITLITIILVAVKKEKERRKKRRRKRRAVQRPQE